MGAIRHEVEIVGLQGRRKVVALFDSGANHNYLPRRFPDGDEALDLGIHVFEGEHNVILADQTVTCGERVRFRELRIGPLVCLDVAFVVLNDLFEEAIVGAKLMQEKGIRLDPPGERIELTRIR